MVQVNKQTRLFTVKEIALLYGISTNTVLVKAKLNRFAKTLHGGSNCYLLSGKQIEKMFNIPTVSDSVIYVNTVWEIYPSKMNYQL